VNDAAMAETVRCCAEEMLGPKRVVEPEPTMGGEDMAFFLEKSKGCFYFLGVGREGCAPLHNPKFDGFVKSPFAALRFTFIAAAYHPSTPCMLKEGSYP
jgi:metal-dependent amidase/aminoacylase/carboxypeptidase family protein